MSIKNKFVLGDFYTKTTMSEIIEEPNLKLVREGLFYCKKLKYFVDSFLILKVKY